MSTTGSVQPTDTQLVAASRFDGVHFVTVFDRHVAAVHRYLAHRLGGSAAAAHLSDAFVAAYGDRRRFRSWNDSAVPWLLGTATGLVRRQWRLEQANLRALAAGPGDRSAGEVADELQHLDGRDRDVLLLVAWEGLACDEVASALDLSDATVAARLDGVSRQIHDRVRSVTTAGGPGVLPASGVDLVRALRPPVAELDGRNLTAVRAELMGIAGHPVRPGAPRPTSAVAAEHEQLRRWRSSPGAALAALRTRGPATGR